MELCLERIHALLPDAPEAAEPLVDLPQGRRLHGVEPARALWPDLGEATVTQHAQVLRYGGLRDAEFLLDHGRDGARAQLAAGEELDDAPSHRIAQDIERMHGANLNY